MVGKRRRAEVGATTSSPRPPKQEKSIRDHTRNALPHDRYTIAWICALPIEMAAARAMLDDIHQNLPRLPNDSNSYILGSIQQQNIVLTCLPNDQYGTNNAAIVGANLMRTFPSIQLGLMVGIGGGAPSRADLRLGDVVVGSRVMQYDLGKAMPNGTIHRTATARVVRHSISTVVSNLRSKHERSPSRVPSILLEKLGGLPSYSRPTCPDRLFSATYEHDSLIPDCSGCDQSKLVPRGPRISADPVIHHGAIGSGNQVIKDSTTRDNLARELDVICFEMEAAGLMDVLPCLPIRGICDYSDSHKTKEWQRHAAATAAACAREFLEVLAAKKEPPETRDEPDCRAQKVALAKRRQRLLESLNFDQVDHRMTSIKSAHSKTCHWFLELPEYRAWLDNQNQAEHHGFLWIKGKPGAGKSTIMKFIYLQTKRKKQSLPTVTASFFFNARGTELEKSVSGMYRSLLLQLLEGFSDLQEVLEDTDLVPRSQSDCPPLNVLKSLFFNSVSKVGSRSFICFIDALDECDEQQVMDMIQFFEELAEHCASNMVQFQIAFSSRHYPYIHIKRGIQLILEDQQGHAEDLDNYVQSHLQIKDSTLLAELLPQLLDKAAGVFLWTVLVVDILNKENRRGRLGLRKRLAEVPAGLSELFKDILKRDHDNMEDLLLCVLWVLCAKNPLSPKEYYHALWSGLALKNLADPEIPTVTGSDAKDCVSSYVITSSKGLAEITKTKSPIVQFIHESVRDFLIKDGGLRDLWPDIGFDWESPSHERLKQCCHSYVNHPSIQSSIVELGKVRSKVLRKITSSYPFLNYATQQVLYHANLAAAAVPQEDFLSQFPLSRWIPIANLFERYEVRHYDLSVHLLYILAERGFSSLIREILKQDPTIDVPGGRYDSPLFAALARVHKDAVAAILGLPSSICDGVDICEGLKIIRDAAGFKNRTPLTWAAENGHIGFANHLLLRGASANDTDREGRLPLMMAIKNGHGAMANLLINEGADIEASENGGSTPLLQAPDEVMVKLLIDKGADIMDAYTRSGGSFIWKALRFGLEATVIWLINNGADVHARDDNGSTLLHEFSLGSNEGAVRLLINKGATIRSRDANRSTPLHLASRGGNEQIVKLLIKNRSGTNYRDNDFRTPLHIASENGMVSVTRLLLENGANVNSRDSYGETPLHKASGNGRVSVMRILFENGANVNSRDNDGATPLHQVLKHETVSPGRFIREAGADIESRDIYSDGRVDRAWRIEIVPNEIPWGIGAGIKPRVIFTESPLDRAMRSRRGPVVKLLMKNGADINDVEVEGLSKDSLSNE